MPKKLSLEHIRIIKILEMYLLITRRYADIQYEYYRKYKKKINLRSKLGELVRWGHLDIVYKPTKHGNGEKAYSLCSRIKYESIGITKEQYGTPKPTQQPPKEKRKLLGWLKKLFNF